MPLLPIPDQGSNTVAGTSAPSLHADMHATAGMHSGFMHGRVHGDAGQSSRTQALFRELGDMDSEDTQKLIDRAARHPIDRSKIHSHSAAHHMTEEELTLHNSYDALDYDQPLTSLYREKYLAPDAASNSRVNIARWLIFAATGIFVGSAAFGVSVAVDKLLEFKFDLVRDHLHAGNYGMAYLAFLLLSCAFVALSAMLVVWGEPVAAGSGIPQLKALLNGTNLKRYLRLRTLAVKLVGVVFSVAGGLVIGKEGPMVHSGASAAANLSHGTGLHKCMSERSAYKLHRFRNDRDKRDFISGGAASGVSAAFSAPLGGLLFSFEEASSFWSIDLTWRTFLAAGLAVFVLNVWKLALQSTDTRNFAGLISFAPPLTDTPYRLWETPIFIGLGIVGGLVGAAFNALNMKLTYWRRGRMAGRRWGRVAEAVLIAGLTATAAFWGPYFVSDCLPVKYAADNDYLVQYDCEPGHYNTLASVVFTPWERSIRGFIHAHSPYSIAAMGTFFAIAFVLAVITYGIAVPSGLFVPCILMGSAYGRALGELLSTALPHAGVQPGVYAIIGATSALGGVSRMTISLTVILLECTADLALAVPIMTVVMVSKWVGDRFNISLYDSHLQATCAPYVETAPSLNMYHLTASDVASAPVHCIPAQATLRDVVMLLTTTRHSGYPVVSTTAPHHYVGTVLRSYLVGMLEAHAWEGGSSHYRGQGVRALEMTDFSTSLSSKQRTLSEDTLRLARMAAEDGAELDVAWAMNPSPVTVQYDCAVGRVYTLFRALGLRHLVVTTRDNRVAGIITRKEVSTAFDHDLF